MQPCEVLTVVCVLWFPAVGWPEIRSLAGEEYEKVRKDTDQPVIPFLRSTGINWRIKTVKVILFPENLPTGSVGIMMTF